MGQELDSDVGDDAERYLRETKGPGAIMLVVTPHKVFSRNYN